MAIVAGDFTKSALRQVMQKSDLMWDDQMINLDFKANVDVFNAIKKEQNANMTILEDGDKERDVKVHWINDCANVAADCDADDCDLSGPELGSDDKVYTMTECKQYKFSVNEMDFRTNHFTMAEVIAKGFLKGDKVLSEAIASTLVARIETFKGVNPITDGIGTPNGVSGDTDIAAADFNADAFAYFYRIAIQNQLSNPFLVSGTNLLEDYFRVSQNRANGEGKGDANLYASMRKYFDVFNIDTINTPDLKTYMINRGAIAFASKHHYNTVPTVYMNQKRFSLKSRNLAGVTFDVFYTNRCVGNDMFHDFKMVIKYDFWNNPLGCDTDRTGVLSFNKV